MNSARMLVLSTSDGTKLDTEFPDDFALFTTAASSHGVTDAIMSHASQLLLLLHLINRLHFLTVTPPIVLPLLSLSLARNVLERSRKCAGRVTQCPQHLRPS